MNLTSFRNPAMNRAENWFPGDLFRPMFPGYDGFRVDVRDTGDSWIMEADLPGVSKDNIDIEITDDVLTVSAEMSGKTEEQRGGYIMSERRTGRFSRSFGIENVAAERICAEYRDGVLTVTLPKKEENITRNRKVEIM